MVNKVTVLIAAVLSFALMSSCTYERKKAMPSATPLVFDDEKPTYASVKKILNKRCSECHGPSSEFPLSNYAQIVLYIMPGSPNSSRLVNEIESGRMPEFGPPLPRVEIDHIKNWIHDGAKEN